MTKALIGVLVAAGIGAGVVLASRGAASKPAAGPAQLGVIVTGDVRGYLEPCGCSEHMLGGMDRVAAQVEKAKQELGAAVHVGAGDELFAGPAQDDAHAQQDALKAKTLLDGFAQMDTAAIALGPRDRARVDGLVDKVAFPVLGPKLGFKVVNPAGIALGLATGDDAAALTANVKAARAAGAEVVLALAELPLPQVVPLGPDLAKAGADVAIAAHQAQDLEGDADHVVDASLPVVTLMNRGRAVARIDLHRVAGAPAGWAVVASTQAQQQDLEARDAEIDSLKKRAHQATGPLKAAMDKKIEEKQAQRDALAAQKPQPPAGRNWLSISFVELSDDKPSSPAVKKTIESFTVALADANLAFAKAHGHDCPAAKKGEPAFAGTETCIGCHTDPGTVWHGTGHSHAYATLEKVHKQYDLDCIRCHVIGVNAPGGVCRVDKVEGKKDVGCEACHGMGSLHAEDPNVSIPVKKPGEQNCRVCHTPENSTAFDYATYLPKILGPGHGK